MIMAGTVVADQRVKATQAPDLGFDGTFAQASQGLAEILADLECRTIKQRPE